MTLKPGIVLNFKTSYYAYHDKTCQQESISGWFVFVFVFREICSFFFREYMLIELIVFPNIQYISLFFLISSFFLSFSEIDHNGTSLK